ncbi:MAG: DUF4388 domain-containing protein [Planctomycetota bacterium]|jgi:pSer/pThr/pTyr-binding forkhead associated (FHA) protein
MKCSKCGYEKNDEGVQMCNLCGEVLAQPGAPAGDTVVGEELATEVPAAPVAPPPAPAAPAAADPGPGLASALGGFSYLKCSLLEQPLRLVPDKAVTIGRGAENDITIPSQMVSRRHGKVVSERGLWVYYDLDSSNGSRVNSKRLAKAVLQSGDIIDLGGFLITYKEIHDLSDVSDQAGSDESKTMAIDASLLKKAMMTGMDGVAMLGGMGGSLSDIAIPDILQLCEIQRKDGTLTLDFEGAVGKIFLLQGKMVHAEYGKIKGENAVFKMLMKKKGSFHLDPRAPECETTMTRDTTSVLLDASREMDEM